MHEGRFATDEKAPPDTWLDFEQRNLKIEVRRHGFLYHWVNPDKDTRRRSDLQRPNRQGGNEP